MYYYLGISDLHVLFYIFFWNQISSNCSLYCLGIRKLEYLIASPGMTFESLQCSCEQTHLWLENGGSERWHRFLSASSSLEFVSFYTVQFFFVSNHLSQKNVSQRKILLGERITCSVLLHGKTKRHSNSDIRIAILSRKSLKLKIYQFIRYHNIICFERITKNIETCNSMLSIPI